MGDCDGIVEVARLEGRLRARPRLRYGGTVESACDLTLNLTLILTLPPTRPDPTTGSGIRFYVAGRWEGARLNGQG